MWGLIVVFTCSVGDIQGEGVFWELLLCFVDITHHIQFEDAESILLGKNLSLKKVLMKSFELSRN